MIAKPREKNTESDMRWNENDGVPINHSNKFKSQAQFRMNNDGAA